MIGPVSIAAQLAAIHSLASIAVRNPQFRLGAVTGLQQMNETLGNCVVAAEAGKVEQALKEFFKTHPKQADSVDWFHFFNEQRRESASNRTF